MVKRAALWSTAIVASSLAACQLLFGIEEKHLAEGAAGSAPEAGIETSPETTTQDTNPIDTTVVDTSVDDTAVNDAAEAEAEAEAGPLTTAYPPGRPDGSADADGGAEAADAGGDAAEAGTLTLVARTFYQGSIDPETGAADFEAWRKFGFDIDYRCTTAEESENNNTGICLRSGLASKFAQEDGDDCRDNAGGRMLTEAYKFLSVDYEKIEVARSQAGLNPSYLLQILDLAPGSEDSYAPARLYVTAPRGPTEDPPLWKGYDKFRVDNTCLVDGGLGAPRITFPKAYMNGNVWVSGDFRTSPQDMPMLFTHRMGIVNTVTTTLTLELDDTHKIVKRSILSTVVSQNLLAVLLGPGVLELVQCDPKLAAAAIKQYIQPHTDLASGSPDFINPGIECDLASFGVQIEWVPAQAPSEVVDVPFVSLCDAGSD